MILTLRKNMSIKRKQIQNIRRAKQTIQKRIKGNSRIEKYKYVT